MADYAFSPYKPVVRFKILHIPGLFSFLTTSFQFLRERPLETLPSILYLVISLSQSELLLLFFCCRFLSSIFMIQLVVMNLMFFFFIKIKTIMPPDLCICLLNTIYCILFIYLFTNSEILCIIFLL